MKKENEIRVLMVEPHEHPKEFLLENTLQAMQEAVGGLIDIVDIDDDGTCLLLNDEGKLIGLEGNRRIGDDEYYPPWEPPVSRFRATRKFLP